MDTFQSDDSDKRRQTLLAAAAELSADLEPAGSVRVASNRSLAMSTLLAAAVFFMAFPAMVAGISMFDRELLGRSAGLLRWIGMLTTCLEILPLALTGLAATAREEA
jgi:hypothetical protein